MNFLRGIWVCAKVNSLSRTLIFYTRYCLSMLTNPGGGIFRCYPWGELVTDMYRRCCSSVIEFCMIEVVQCVSEGGILMQCVLS